MSPTSLVLHCHREDVFLRGHEAFTLTHVARRLAELIGCEFATIGDAAIPVGCSSSRSIRCCRRRRARSA